MAGGTRFGASSVGAIRTLTDEVLASLSGWLEVLRARVGRPSIPPEMLLRATLLQPFFSIRSERTMMKQVNYNLLFRWFDADRDDKSLR